MVLEGCFSVIFFISEKGNKFRKGNGYYSSSSFYYEGESYWGVDRLNHLENRLIDLGLKRTDTDEYIIKRKNYFHLA